MTDSLVRLKFENIKLKERLALTVKDWTNKKLTQNGWELVYKFPDRKRDGVLSTYSLRDTANDINQVVAQADTPITEWIYPALYRRMPGRNGKAQFMTFSEERGWEFQDLHISGRRFDSLLEALEDCEEMVQAAEQFSSTLENRAAEMKMLAAKRRAELDQMKQDAKANIAVEPFAKAIKILNDTYFPEKAARKKRSTKKDVEGD